MRGRAGARGLVAVAAIGAGLIVAAPASAEITPLAQFGTPGGDAAGELAGADYIAIDPANGDLYVTDESNHRIAVFNRDGAFLRAWGTDVDPTNAFTGPETCTATCQFGQGGDAAGELHGPEGIALSAAGEVFVSEYVNDRISVFTKQGQFLRAFGRGVTGTPAYGVCATTCSAGIGNGTAGAMNNPAGITFGPDGNLYLADDNNNRINVYAPSGAFVRSIGLGVASNPLALEACTDPCSPGFLSGHIEGSISGPRDVAFDGSGLLWIAEADDHRVSAISPSATPTFVRMIGFDVGVGGGTGFEVCGSNCKVGVGGDGPGQFSSAHGVVADQAGNVYVADGTNHRVAVYTAASGAFQKAFGGDVTPGSPFEFDVCTTSCQVGDQDDFPGAFDRPKGLAVDCRGGLYAGEGFGGRIQRFGEPGLLAPPCPPNEAPRPTSNAFEITKVKRNKRKGTAKAFVAVPGPGALALAGGKLKAASARPEAAGTATLTIKARGKAKRRLRERGTAKVRFAITYMPDGGNALTQSRKLKLKLKRRLR